ncbi:hypothetical protein M427DRAFT_68826 [Gonapodya prolifera JEL478]|uniref:U6 snRNA phosphodiesterase 1 n=1 Tax=Gonapodya prolifera (strain JEL478) TaxID=1344416 RepID=A0A139AJ21_GONPJ|nr:hypothetical protein M427DRAFT_68826 [Gonapodya prolifera JEL478]|eukprot:KXS16790.1 hypothetical protein M427DRAFT_68826 [Gonapodya prolifera JEL478]
MSLVDYSSDEDVHTKNDQVSATGTGSLPSAALPEGSESQVANTNHPQARVHSQGDWLDLSSLGGTLHSLHNPFYWHRTAIAYIPVSLSEDQRSLVERIVARAREFEPSLRSLSRDGSYTSLHVSLTRPVILRIFQLEAFTKGLEMRASKRKQFRYSLGSFKTYQNYNKSQTFLALDVLGGKRDFNNLVSDSDAVLATFQLPQYYATPSFHVSIAWTDVETRSENLLRTLSDEFADELGLLSGLHAGCVECKAGNKMVRILLRG